MKVVFYQFEGKSSWDSTPKKCVIEIGFMGQSFFVRNEIGWEEITKKQMADKSSILGFSKNHQLQGFLGGDWWDEQVPKFWEWFDSSMSFNPSSKLDR
jgi:hypothetical protein